MKPKYGKILHLGIVVRDLKKALEIYEDKLGIGPWEVEDPRPFFADKKVNDGYGLNINTAMYKGDGYEIELVMPVGPGIYEDWLRDRGPGLHHIKFETDVPYEETVKLGEEVSPDSHYLDIYWEDGSPLVSYISMLEETGLILEYDPHSHLQNPSPSED